MTKKLCFLSIVLFLCGVARGEDRILFFNYDATEGWRVHLYKTTGGLLRGYETVQEIDDPNKQLGKSLVLDLKKTSIKNSKQLTHITDIKDHQYYFRYLDNPQPSVKFILLKDIPKDSSIELSIYHMFTDNKAEINAVVQDAINKKFILPGTPLPYPKAGSAKSETAGQGGEKLLTGLALENFSGTPDCKGITINYLWPKPGTAGCIHFYDNGNNYYCFANTFQNGSQDPKVGVNADFSYLIDTIKWITTEHYFQAQKFQNPQVAYTDMKNKNLSPGGLPGAVNSKTESWNTQKIDTKKWREISHLVMLKAVRAKFSQHDKLKNALLGTYPNMLIEDTTQILIKQSKAVVDIMWGAGTNYTGCNQLGQILMHVRQELHDGKLYEFKKGDAKYYYDLLSGAKWPLSTDKTYVPKGYEDVFKTTPKTGTETSTVTGGDADLIKLAQALHGMV